MYSMRRIFALGGALVVAAALAGCGPGGMLESPDRAQQRIVEESRQLAIGLAALTPEQKEMLNRQAQLRYDAEVICQARNQMYQATTPGRGAFGGIEVMAMGNRAERACYDAAVATGRLPAF
jgi:predicted small lipoprotein YifL